MSALAWFLVGFWAGALPFSVWLSRAFARADPRHLGDGNPGAANAWRAGGWRVGLAVLLLDYLKGALPVGAAHFAAGLTGWPLACAAVAPLLGHAFSPFLRLRGGKGLAVTFGLWSGLTLAQAPMVLGLGMVVFYLIVSVEAWTVILSLLGLLGYLLIQPAESALLAVWLVNLAVIVWTHRRELRHRPRLKFKISRQCHA